MKRILKQGDQWYRHRFIENICLHAHKHPTLNINRLVDYFASKDEKGKISCCCRDISDVTESVRNVGYIKRLAEYKNDAFDKKWLASMERDN